MNADLRRLVADLREAGYAPRLDRNPLGNACLHVPGMDMDERHAWENRFGDIVSGGGTLLRADGEDSDLELASNAVGDDWPSGFPQLSGCVECRSGPCQVALMPGEECPHGCGCYGGDA